MALLRPKKLDNTSLTIAAAAILVLSACQSNQALQPKQTGRNWQVIESLGDARIENSHSPYSTHLRSGDEIVDDSRVVTGSSSHLILSRGDVQLTASSDSSISLPRNTSPSTLSHNYGSVRIRLATAANATKLITTPHLAASGTNAVLELQVTDRESQITVTSGNVVLSTSNGQHHTQLAAGASARLGSKTNGQLELRPAADLPFRPSRALASTSSSKESDKPDDGFETEALLPDGLKADNLSATTNEVIVVPASRLKTKILEPGMASANRSVNKPDSSTSPMKATGTIKRIAIDHDEPADQIQLQEQFDNLTKGLLGNLPTASSKTDQGL